MKKTKLEYTFKFYYKDKTERVVSARARSPEDLYNDFDGLLDWNEYENLFNKKLSTKDILLWASKAYKSHSKDFYRIEIVNINTKEIVDFIEC